MYILVLILILLFFLLLGISYGMFYTTILWGVAVAIPHVLGWSFGASVLTYTIIFQLIGRKTGIGLMAFVTGMVVGIWILQSNLDWDLFDNIRGQFIGSTYGAQISSEAGEWTAYGLSAVACLIGVYAGGLLTGSTESPQFGMKVKNLFEDLIVMFYGGSVKKMHQNFYRSLRIVAGGILIWVGGAVMGYLSFINDSKLVKTNDIFQMIEATPGEILELQISGETIYRSAFPGQRIGPFGTSVPLKTFYQNLPPESWDAWAHSQIGSEWPFGSLVIKITYPSRPETPPLYVSIMDLDTDTTGIPPLFGQERTFLSIPKTPADKAMVTFLINTTDQHPPKGALSIRYRATNLTQAQLNTVYISAWDAVKMLGIGVSVIGIFLILFRRQSESTVEKEGKTDLEHQIVKTTKFVEASLDNNQVLLSNDLAVETEDISAKLDIVRQRLAGHLSQALIHGFQDIDATSSNPIKSLVLRKERERRTKGYQGLANELNACNDAISSMNKTVDSLTDFFMRAGHSELMNKIAKDKLELEHLENQAKKAEIRTRIAIAEAESAEAQKKARIAGQIEPAEQDIKKPTLEEQRLAYENATNMKQKVKEIQLQGLRKQAEEHEKYEATVRAENEPELADAILDRFNRLLAEKDL